MTSVFLTISVLCLWAYMIIIERQNNKRYKEDIEQRTETLNVMKRMWDFEKELCEKLNDSNHDNLVYSASNSEFANHKLEKKIDKRQKKIKISTN